jgi:hypothetical protein
MEAVACSRYFLKVKIGLIHLPLPSHTCSLKLPGAVAEEVQLLMAKQEISILAPWL